MYEALKQVDLFAELAEEDLQRLSAEVEEVRLGAGEILFNEGAPGNRAYIIIEGELEVLKDSGGRGVLLAVRTPGEVIGEMALLEQRPRMASVRARVDSRLLAIHKEQFDHLLRSSPAATSAMFHSILGRLRETEALLRQSEKMAHLGTLTAGIAHELNNPAAAVKRGAEQLTDAIDQFVRKDSELPRLDLSDPQREGLEALGARAQDYARDPIKLDALSRSDRETAIEDWLDGQGIPDPWNLSPALVNLNYTPEDLSALGESYSPEQLPQIVAWMDSTFTVYSLLAEISQGSRRMSEIVKALKSYSYLDQAPVQAVNVHEGLEDTLVILRNKISAGVDIRREFDPALPEIQAYGSELNQVWTNILDNALDALNGKGVISLRTRGEGDSVVVEIEDNGPGIPEDVLPRIFEAFYTTKPVGKGTGLGLDISYKIVVFKHRGDIKVFSEPGKTRFEVWLPVNFEER